MLNETDIVEFQVLLLNWYDKNKRSFPWRYTFNPYLVLVSEVLLQQTNVDKVITPYNSITNTYSSIDELSEASIEFLHYIFKPIGLFYRANRLLNIALDIKNNYNSIIPSERDKLIKLNGIGDYTCNAILCFGYNKPYAIVDTNIIRIFSRVFNFVSDKDRPRNDKKLWNFAQELLPVTRYVDFNYALLDYAASICTTSNPKCTRCSLKYTCVYQR